MHQILIQKKQGEFATVNAWVAWSGFEQKAYPITFFEWPQLRDGEFAVTQETLVVGGVATVVHALRSLGVEVPNLDYPLSLRRYLGRDLIATTMGAVRARFEADETTPRFVKPRENHKAFTGYVISAFRDLIPTASQPDDLAVWMSETVNFISEWRYFVQANQVLGVGHYRGDPFVHPDSAIVRSAIAEFQCESPVAYGIDFGITANGQTLLVEVNDAYSLGHLGLRPVPYANMLEARWKELVKASAR